MRNGTISVPNNVALPAVLTLGCTIGPPGLTGLRPVNKPNEACNGTVNGPDLVALPAVLTLGCTSNVSGNSGGSSRNVGVSTT